jgi:hypothetical protein
VLKRVGEIEERKPTKLVSGGGHGNEPVATPTTFTEMSPTTTFNYYGWSAHERSGAGSFRQDDCCGNLRFDQSSN